MERHRPTMKDVAERAGVSFKTVSRVINGESRVSKSTIERVQSVIDEIGYAPDDRARSLRRARQDLSTAAIGVIHADLANPFFASVNSGLEEVAAEAGTVILIGSSLESRERQDAILSAFTRRRVSGLAIVPADGSNGLACSPALTYELERGTPLVFIDRDPGLPADVVMSDHRGGGALAGRHLLSMGHRKIAFLGDDPRLFSASQRLEGLLESLSHAGIEPVAVVSDASDQGRAEQVTNAWMALPETDRPTAIFAAQNILARGVVKGLHRLGLQHDIALVGFDDIEMGDVIEPGLTTVPQDTLELGRRACQLLFARIEGDTSAPKREIVPVTLVERGSGEIRCTR